MNNQEIDCGFGVANVDKDNGIRYGVISQGSLDPDCIDEAVCEGAYYGEPTCPECGGDAVSSEDFVDTAEIVHDDDCEDSAECECGVYTSYSERGCDDFVCQTCRHTLDSSEVFSEEMLGWSLDDGEYKLQDCLYSDVFVIESPYYTYAAFCSPCVPGACSLDSPIEPEYSLAGSPKCYALGHDWFEDGTAPYRLFRVSDNTEVLAEVTK